MVKKGVYFGCKSRVFLSFFTVLWVQFSWFEKSMSIFKMLHLARKWFLGFKGFWKKVKKSFSLAIWLKTGKNEYTNTLKKQSLKGIYRVFINYEVSKKWRWKSLWLKKVQKKIKKQRIGCISNDFHKKTVLKGFYRGSLTFKANFCKKISLLFQVLRGFYNEKWKKGVSKNHHQKKSHLDMPLFFRKKVV